VTLSYHSTNNKRISVCVSICMSVCLPVSLSVHTCMSVSDAGIVRSHRMAEVVRFCSVLQPSSIRGLATPWTYFLHLSLSSVILTGSSTGNIQAVHGLPRLCAPGIVLCIISFSRQFPCFSWCDHSMLASLLLVRWCLTVPSLLQLC